MKEVVSQVEADTAIHKALALVSKASRELQTICLQSQLYFHEGRTGGYGARLGRNVFNHTTESPSKEEEASDRTGIRCFFKVGTTTKPNRNQPNSQSEKLSFFPKVYSRKQSASPSYLNGYCCLRTAGYARQLPGIQSRTFNTAHWSHIPQNQGRRGSTGSGDCRVDYKGVSPILTIMTPTKLVFSIKYSRREVFNKLCCSGFSKT